MACSTAWGKSWKAAVRSEVSGRQSTPAGPLQPRGAFLCAEDAPRKEPSSLPDQGRSPYLPRLRFHKACGQSAGTGCWSQAAESVQEIGQVGERNLEQVGAAQGGADFVEHAVATGDDNRAS